MFKNEHKVKINTSDVDPTYVRMNGDYLLKSWSSFQHLKYSSHRKKGSGIKHG